MGGPTRRALVQFRPWLVVALAMSLGCAVTRYETAVGQFGSAASSGAEGAIGVVGSAQETCRNRAWLHQITDGFQRPGFARGTDPMSLSSNVPRPSGGGQLSWKEYCDLLADYDKAIQNAITSLAAYGSALSKIASKDAAKIDGSLTGPLASASVDIARELGSSSLDKARELSEPVTALANIVLHLIKVAEIKDVVRRADSPMKTILGKLNQYLQASKDQVEDARQLSADIFRQVDAVIPAWRGETAIPAALPGQVLALFEFSRQQAKWFAALDEQIAAASHLVADLGEAHEKLVQGADGAIEDSVVLQSVTEKTQDVVKQLNRLHKLKL